MINDYNKNGYFSEYPQERGGEMTNPKLAEIFAYVVKNANDDPEKMSMVLSSAVNSAYELGRADENEECAKLCEENDEVTVLSTNRRYLEKKTSNNVNGNAYAAGIRSRRKGTGEVGA